MKKFWILKIVGFVLVIMVVAGFVVEMLWNALLPHLFHFPEITYWEALGILILSKLLFGGFKGRHGGGHPGWRGAWRARWEAKIAKMSPEEREKFKAAWEKKCGSGPWMWQNQQNGPWCGDGSQNAGGNNPPAAQD